MSDGLAPPDYESSVKRGRRKQGTSLLKVCKCDPRPHRPAATCVGARFVVMRLSDLPAPSTSFYQSINKQGEGKGEWIEFLPAGR